MNTDPARLRRRSRSTWDAAGGGRRYRVRRVNPSRFEVRAVDARSLPAGRAVVPSLAVAQTAVLMHVTTGRWTRDTATEG